MPGPSWNNTDRGQDRARRLGREGEEMKKDEEWGGGGGGGGGGGQFKTH